MPAEKVRLRIGNLAKAVLVTGQAYQDPKDALNEFVSNAADAYAEGGRRGERITVSLRRRSRFPVIAVDDLGPGMSPDRLREVARSLFESTKVGDSRTIGEKAIGVLAFQQLGRRCDIVSRTADSDETWALRLERGQATASLERERRRVRQSAGTTVYVSDLDPDVLRVLTQRKVVDYLRARRGPALARGDYSIEVIEGRLSEVVLPERPDGIRLAIRPWATLWGRVEFALYIAPPDGKQRRVSVVGRGGTVIIDDMSELDEFAGRPWTTDQVAGQIVFESLQQTAGRRAIVRDREAFPVFLEAVRAIEPVVAATVERVAREVDTATVDRLAEVIRRIFARVLRELEDVDNPMRAPVGSEPGEGAMFGPLPASRAPSPERDDGTPNIESPNSPSQPPTALADSHDQARSDGSRSRPLPSVGPDPLPGEARSRFDPEAGIVLYNESHADYLLVKDSEAALVDYLAALVAKEYVIYNNPRAQPADIGEEMVRMLVRVRRHLPRRS